MTGVATAFAQFLAGMTKKPSFFIWGSDRLASVSDDRVQDVEITVRGKYRPSLVRVTQGIPVRMRFIRDEDEECSGRVVFSGMGIERRLLPFSETLIEFVPETVGEYLFTCEMGMYRGRLIVEPNSQS